MAVHMFRCFIGVGEMSISDLEARINDWVANNHEWPDDSVPHTLAEYNTAVDGTGEAYHGVNVRFLKDDTKDNLLQKFTGKLKDKVAWYRVGYHECTHNQTDATPCEWNDKTEWSNKDVTIPGDIPTVEVTT